MRTETIVEILPDGRAALRLVILPPIAPELREEDVDERGVIEIPMHEPESDDDGRVIVWQM